MKTVEEYVNTAEQLVDLLEASTPPDEVVAISTKAQVYATLAQVQATERQTRALVACHNADGFVCDADY